MYVFFIFTLNHSCQFNKSNIDVVVLVLICLLPEVFCMCDALLYSLQSVAYVKKSVKYFSNFPALFL